MADFKSMYFRLFDKVTDAVNILQSAQQEGEDAYTESDDENIIKLFNNERNEDG